MKRECKVIKGEEETPHEIAESSSIIETIKVYSDDSLVISVDCPKESWVLDSESVKDGANLVAIKMVLRMAKKLRVDDDAREREIDKGAIGGSMIEVVLCYRLGVCKLMKVWSKVKLQEPLETRPKGGSNDKLMVRSKVRLGAQSGI